MSFLPLETPMYPVITSLNSLYLVEQKSDFFFPLCPVPFLFTCFQFQVLVNAGPSNLTSAKQR